MAMEYGRDAFDRTRRCGLFLYKRYHITADARKVNYEPEMVPKWEMEKFVIMCF